MDEVFWDQSTVRVAQRMPKFVVEIIDGLFVVQVFKLVRSVVEFG